MRRARYRQVASNDFDYACNACERIADFVGEPGRKFSECGQAFHTRHLGAVQPFHLFPTLAQLLDHVVEATTEASDFVVAIGKTYCDIEFPFAEADNLNSEVPP